MRRRHGAWPVLTAALAVAGCGGGAATADRAEPTAPAAPVSTTAPAPAPAPRPSLRRAVGARIMTGMVGTQPDASLLRRVRRGEVGGVILMGENVSPALPTAIRALQRAARDGGGRPLLIATDQEGGLVRRIASAPPTASAQAMGARGADSARAQGAAAGRALRDLGVTVDLAPVADVQHEGGFLGSRAFGSAPAAVARSACAFAAGLAGAGVAATLKHFPGLGAARQNTDEAVVSIGAPARALRRDLEPYRRCARGAALVMLANAAYPALDGATPAVFSRRIAVGLLRGTLGFRGVTISDTMSAPAVQGPRAALRAARAGVDVLLYVGQAESARAYAELLAAARRGALPRSGVDAAAARIRALQGAREP